jgi:hypothetical protein
MEKLIDLYVLALCGLFQKSSCSIHTATSVEETALLYNCFNYSFDSHDVFFFQVSVTSCLLTSVHKKCRLSFNYRTM